MTTKNQDALKILVVGDIDGFEMTFTPMEERLPFQSRLRQLCKVTISPEDLQAPISNILGGMILSGHSEHEAGEPIYSSIMRMKSVIRDIGYDDLTQNEAIDELERLDSLPLTETEHRAMQDHESARVMFVN